MAIPLIIDTVGLPESELTQARSLLGGSTASIRALPFDQAMSFVRERRKESLYITLVIEWGQSELDRRLWPLLAAPRTIVLDFAFVIGNMLWRGDIIPRNEWGPAGSPYDRGDQGWISVDGQLESAPNFIINWWDPDAGQKLEIYTSQRISTMPLIGDLGNFIVLPGPIRPLQPRRIAAPSKPSEPPLKPLDLGHRLEQQLGWPTERYSSPPSEDEAARLANQVLGAKGLRWANQPLAICAQLGIPVRFHAKLRRYNAYLDFADKSRKSFIIGVSLESVTDRVAEFGDAPDQDHQLWLIVLSCMIAHELAHTFFYDWVPGAWPAPIDHLNTSYGDGGVYHAATERFCEVFAQALLWPSANGAQRQLMRRLVGDYVNTWRPTQ